MREKRSVARIAGWCKLLHLFSLGPVTRAQARKSTGFSADFVTNIFIMLEDQNIIHFSGYVADRGGRLQVEEFRWGPGERTARRKKSSDVKLPVTTKWRGFTFDVEKPPSEKGRRKQLWAIPEAVSKVATAE